MILLERRGHMLPQVLLNVCEVTLNSVLVSYREQATIFTFSEYMSAIVLKYVIIELLTDTFLAHNTEA